MNIQKKSFVKAGKSAFSLLLFVVISWHMLPAQISPNIGVQYNEDSNQYMIPAANIVREMTIEAQPAYDRLFFYARGGDGGHFNCDGTACDPQKGGSGASVQAVFEIGDQADQIPPLSTIRMITGLQGESEKKNVKGAGGGGGTGILLLRPGGDPARDEDWTVLLVAGGGGGAAMDGEGRSGNDSTSGLDHNGHQENYDGTGGRHRNGFGGGGAFENGGFDNTSLNNGRLGFPNGGNGGAGDANKGGWGFGGGGSGHESGGGGGGYSGGSGGTHYSGNSPISFIPENDYYGGGGGGSYVHPMAVRSSMKRNDKTSHPKNGGIVVQLFNAISFDNLNISFPQTNDSPLQLEVDVNDFAQLSGQFMSCMGSMSIPIPTIFIPNQPIMLGPGLYSLTIVDNTVPNNWNQTKLYIALEPEQAIAIMEDGVSTSWNDQIRYGDATVHFVTSNNQGWKLLLDKKGTSASPYRTGYSGLFKSLSTDQYTLTIANKATNKLIDKSWTFHIGVDK